MKRPAWLEEVDLQDACIVVGMVLLAAGVGWIYPPAALIVLGVILLGLALWRM